MYTIIRFTSQEEALSELDKIGVDMNRVRPGTYTGLRRRGDGFACDIWKGSDWMDHERSALEFVTIFSRHVEQAQKIGAQVTVDMALRSDDLKRPIASVHFSAELLRMLGKNEVALEMTIYTGQPFAGSAQGLPEPE